MTEGRDTTTGRFLPGNPGNPGGVPARQKAMLRQLEGLSDRALEVLRDTMNGPDAKLALEAAKEVVKRLVPAKPPAATNVNVAVGLAGSGIQETLALVAMRRLHRAGRVSDAEMAAVSARPGPLAAIPAPAAIDVEAVPAKPADSEDE